jgi:hypothetical protein
MSSWLLLFVVHQSVQAEELTLQFKASSVPEIRQAQTRLVQAYGARLRASMEFMVTHSMSIAPEHLCGVAEMPTEKERSTIVCKENSKANASELAEQKSMNERIDHASSNNTKLRWHAHTTATQEQQKSR